MAETIALVAVPLGVVVLGIVHTIAQAKVSMARIKHKNKKG